MSTEEGHFEETTESPYYYEQGADYDAENEVQPAESEAHEDGDDRAGEGPEEGEEEGVVAEDNKQETGEIIPQMLFISRFRHGSTTKEQVQDYFAPYGPIKKIIVHEKIAFVEYVNPEDAAKAKQATHYAAGLGSDSLIVDFKKANPPKEKSTNAPQRVPRQHHNGNRSHHNHPDQSRSKNNHSHNGAASGASGNYRQDRRSGNYDDRRDYGEKHASSRPDYRNAPPPPHLDKPREYRDDYRSDPYARPPPTHRHDDRGPPPPYDGRYPYDSRDSSRGPPPPHHHHAPPHHPSHHHAPPPPSHHHHAPPPHYPPHAPPHAPHHPPSYHAPPPPPPHNKKRGYEEFDYSPPPPRGPSGPRGPSSHFPRGPPPHHARPSGYDDRPPAPRFDQHPPRPDYHHQAYPGPRGPPPPAPLDEWNERGSYRPPRDPPGAYPPRPRYEEYHHAPPGPRGPGPRGYPPRGDHRAPPPMGDYHNKRTRY